MMLTPADVAQGLCNVCHRVRSGLITLYVVDVLLSTPPRALGG